jgi:succinate dehydrogenase / fumarate reductase flavoprotein subunit
MQDLVVIDGKARGLLVTGEIERHSAHAVLPLEDTEMYFSYRLMRWVVMQLLLGKYIKGRFLLILATNKYLYPVSGDHQSKLTLMSESLRNDGRIWVPAKLEDAQAIREGKKKPTDLSEAEGYYLEEDVPCFGNLVPRDIASRAAKERCDAGLELTKQAKRFI